MTAAVIAKRTLFHLGHELPGRRLRQLATHLLLATRDQPDASAQELVERAVSTIEDGPTVLVAEEPQLRQRSLEAPATVEEGSMAAVTALGHKLVATYRQR